MKKRILSKLNCCNSNRQRNFFVETVLINSTVFCSDFDANFLLLDSRKGINQKLPDEIVSKRIFKYGGELRNVKNFTPFRLHNSGMSGMSHLFGELRNVRNFTPFRLTQECHTFSENSGTSGISNFFEAVKAERRYIIWFIAISRPTGSELATKWPSVKARSTEAPPESFGSWFPKILTVRILTI